MSKKIFLVLVIALLTGCQIGTSIFIKPPSAFAEDVHIKAEVPPSETNIQNQGQNVPQNTPQNEEKQETPQNSTQKKEASTTQNPQEKTFWQKVADLFGQVIQKIINFAKENPLAVGLLGIIILLAILLIARGILSKLRLK